MWIRIDKAKVQEQMRKANIATFNELGEATNKHGLSQRTLYDVLNSQDWSTKQVYALCEVLGCNPIDILSFDMKRLETGKAEAPSGEMFNIPIIFKLPAASNLTEVLN